MRAGSLTTSGKGAKSFSLIRLVLAFNLLKCVGSKQE